MTRRVPEEVLEAIADAGVESSAASAAEKLASCSGVGGVVGSGTPSAQCLCEVSFFFSVLDVMRGICLPVVTVGFAVTSGSRDGVLGDDCRCCSKKKSD